MTLSALAAQHQPSAYERLLGWTSIAPVLLLIVLLVELEMLRVRGGRGWAIGAPVLLVVAVPLGTLVLGIGLVRAVKLVT
jgi:hypothetical protein